MEVSKRTVAGELAQAPLKLEGSGVWKGDRGSVRGLQALWGDYRMSVNGEVGAASDLVWTVDLPDLTRAGQFVAGDGVSDWRGSVAGSGKVLGALDAYQLPAD